MDVVNMNSTGLINSHPSIISTTFRGERKKKHARQRIYGQSLATSKRDAKKNHRENKPKNKLMERKVLLGRGRRIEILDSVCETSFIDYARRTLS
jgi:hypothetical protein